MALKFKKKVLLVKIQPTAGTDAAPTGAANAIRAENVTINPIVADKVKRPKLGLLGAAEVVHVGAHVMMEFDVEAAGSGAAGTAPAWGPCMRACAMSETINAGTDVQYDPIDSSEEIVSVYLVIDGQKHAMIDARGSWSLKAERKGFPMWHFQLIGLWVDPAAVTHPTPDYSSFQTPLAITNANTPTATWNSINLTLGAINIGQNAALAYRNMVGAEEITISDRDINGDMNIEAPALGTTNYFTTVLAETEAAFQLIHGGTAGAIVQIDGPNVQLDIDGDPYKDEDGATMLDLKTMFIPSDSGNDEIKITVK